MRKTTLLLFLGMLCTLFSFGQVQIGDGTNQSQNLPFEPFYGYSYAQSIYLSSEINASGDITGIQWYFSGTSTLPDSQNLVLSIGDTSEKVNLAYGSSNKTFANCSMYFTRTSIKCI